MPSILVIEDEKALLGLIKQRLLQSGYQVEVAGNGSEGIRKFNDGIFDIVITDFLMPGIDGNDVLEHIRATQKQYTPVICISGTPWLPDRNNFDSILNKPFTFEVLDQIIKDYL